MNMTPIENLHYAIGVLAYAVAHADGDVQVQERQKFHNIIAAGLRCEKYGFNISDIIFRILDKDKESPEVCYKWAMNQVNLNGHYLSPELKTAFIKIMEKIAKAYPPVVIEERNLIDKFKEDIENVMGDPVYYDIYSGSR